LVVIPSLVVRNLPTLATVIHRVQMVIVQSGCRWDRKRLPGGTVYRTVRMMYLGAQFVRKSKRRTHLVALPLLQNDLGRRVDWIDVPGKARPDIGWPLRSPRTTDIANGARWSGRANQRKSERNHSITSSAVAERNGEKVSSRS